VAARHLGIAELGLSLGGSADAAKLGPIGHALAAGRSAEACLQAHIAAMPTLQSHVMLQLLKQGPDAVMVHGLVGDDETAWLLYEGAAAFHVFMLRHLLGADWVPKKVVFPHACKGRRTAYEDWFQAPVAFGSGSQVRIYMQRAALACPLRAAALAGGTPVGRDDTASVGTIRLGASDTRRAVERIIRSSLPEGPVTLPQAAGILGQSARTIQRRLADDGTDYETLVDDCRKVKARELLASPGASVTAVAMELGYSDAAHFNRAFRRWEGESPQDFRRTLSTRAVQRA
jgi:AraC-like DNA-binding protein